jgi:DNA-binding MarR family transcriptional regulator
LREQQADPHPELHDIANRLHSIAIHLLRRLRKVDELAAAEQVKPPTMTRLVQALEADGYVVRAADPLDGRVSRIEASSKGQKVMMEGRQNRVHMLAGLLADLSAAEQKALRKAVGRLEGALTRAGLRV